MRRTAVRPRSHGRSTLIWRALGTYVYLAVDDPTTTGEAGRIATELLDVVDRTCSRFRDDSDLARANAAAGRWVGVDPVLAAATAVAVEAAEATDGLVDPCLGRRLVALGYDADMALVRDRDPHAFTIAPPAHHDPDLWRALRVDRDGAIRVPAGAQLDLGATAKAWASDLVATSVSDELGCRVVVSLGGDVRIAGAGSEPWPVRITERPDDIRGDVILLESGGLATSSTEGRTWQAGAVRQHHLIDPRTGQPTQGRWRTVTATGPTSVAANVATTAAVVLGDGAVGWLESHDVTARLVATDGAVHVTGGWPARTTDHPDHPPIR